MFQNKNFKFSAKINVDEVRMIYVDLSATSERSTTPVLSRVKIIVVTQQDIIGGFWMVLCPFLLP